MKFKMNNETWEIKEVNQSEFEESGQHTKEEGYFFGQSHFSTQEIWIDKSLNKEKKRKTLYHELMHCYLKCYVTNQDIEFPEEVLCDISANSHDIIHDIVEKYFNK